MANLRERSTSFRADVFHVSLKAGVIGLTGAVLFGKAFGTLVSPIVGGVYRSLHGSVGGGVDLSGLVVLRNPEALASVASLAETMSEGITAPYPGVILNAATIFILAVSLFPGREGDQFQ